MNSLYNLVDNLHSLSSLSAALYNEVSQKTHDEVLSILKHALPDLEWNYTVTNTMPDTEFSELDNFWGKMNMPVSHICNHEIVTYNETITNIITELMRTPRVVRMAWEFATPPNLDNFLPLFSYDCTPLISPKQYLMYTLQLLPNIIAQIWTEWRTDQYAHYSNKTTLLHWNIDSSCNNYTLFVPWIFTTDLDFHNIFHSLSSLTDWKSNVLWINEFYWPKSSTQHYEEIMTHYSQLIESILTINPEAHIQVVGHSAWSIITAGLLKKYPHLKWLLIAPAIDRNNIYSSSLENMYNTICWEDFDYKDEDFCKRITTFLAKKDDVIADTELPVEDNHYLEWGHMSCFQHANNKTKLEKSLMF